MNAEFSRTLSLLRQEKGVSQRTAAGVLGISQALLSHYENGIREPGLAFVVKACDYYGVSADYLLGRTLTRDGTTIGTEELYDISDEKDNSMRGSVLALLSKKLLVNSIGMLFDLLGNKLGLSRKNDIPKFLRSKWFRYGFLIFFFIMFFNMLFSTYLVFEGTRNLKEVVTLLWTIKLPWNWAYHGTAVAEWVAQFAFGFYSVMLTSTVLGLITMILYKPRSWCVYCPMGTMTQTICKAKHRCNGACGIPQQNDSPIT